MTRSGGRDIALAAIGLALVSGGIALAHLLGVVYCPLRRWTGLPCPLCGTVRAGFKMLEGDFVGAFAMQPLGTAIAIGTVAVCIACLFPRVRASLGAWCRRHVATIAAVLVSAAIVNWIYILWRQP